MSRKHLHAILLTACVNPKGMANTALQNPGERCQQYLNAIRFYLKNTDAPIVVCENTGYDFSPHFPDEVASGRMECLCFEGNDYDKALGKGYGEALIMLHALKHSSLLLQSKNVVKITGRLCIENIGAVLSGAVYRLDNVFRCNFASDTYCRTMIITFKPQPFYTYLNDHYHIITDDGENPIAIENVIADYLRDSKDVKVIPFMKTPLINGVKGQTNTQYENKNNATNIADNLYFLSALMRKKGRNAYALWLKAVCYGFNVFKKAAGR